MTYSATVYKVLIASPGALGVTRGAAAEEIYQWNNEHSDAMEVVLLPVRWETDATPELGARPQAIINKQLVDESDILVGIFHSRIGSPTGVAESGTIEEIRRFMRSGRPALVYFSTAPLPSDVDLQQVGRVRDLKKEMHDQGILGDFATDEELRRSLARHLMATVRRLQDETDQQASEVDVVATSEPTTTTRKIQQEVAVSPIEQLDLRLSRLDELTRRFQLYWETELASEPNTIEGGVEILRQLRFDLLVLRTDEEIASRALLTRPLDAAVAAIAKLERHQLFIDGGRSYREFWSRGGEIIDILRSVERVLRAAVDMSQDPQDARSQEYLRSKKACIRLAIGAGCGFPNSRNSDRIGIDVPIRNEGEHTAYDIMLTIAPVGFETAPIATASLATLQVGETVRLAVSLPRSPQIDPPRLEHEQYRLHFTYRDGLGKDEVVLFVHFTGILGESFKGEVDQGRTISSPLCAQVS